MILVGKGKNQSTNKILTKKRGGVLATGPGVAVAKHLTKQLKGLILTEKKKGGDHLAHKVVHAHLYSQNLGAEQVGLPLQLT